jgi:hypothetical protein
LGERWQAEKSEGPLRDPISGNRRGCSTGSSDSASSTGRVTHPRCRCYGSVCFILRHPILGVMEVMEYCEATLHFPYLGHIDRSVA